jgi:hypothetical protein
LLQKPCGKIWGILFRIQEKCPMADDSWTALVFKDFREGIRNVVADVVKDMKVNNEPIPEPIAVKHYSGKFMVRVPPRGASRSCH